MKVTQETGVKYFTFVSQSFKVIRRDDDYTYVLKDIFEILNFTANAGQSSGLRRQSWIGHQPPSLRKIIEDVHGVRGRSAHPADRMCDRQTDRQT